MLNPSNTKTLLLFLSLGPPGHFSSQHHNLGSLLFGGAPWITDHLHHKPDSEKVWSGASIGIIHFLVWL